MIFSIFNLSCFLIPDNNLTNSAISGSSPSPEINISLNDIEAGRKAIKILLPDPSGKQYLLIENKVKISNTWTGYLPGDGLLILRINENFTSAEVMSSNNVNVGINSIHGVEIVEADGTNGFDLRKKIDYGSSNDTFYYGNSDKLTPDSIPPQIYFTNNYYSGSNKAYIYIEKISAKSNYMTFTVRD